MISNGGKVRQKLNNVIALIIGVFIAIFISEIILQILDLPHKPISGWLNCKVKNHGECNQLGFRGREINYAPDDFVVILLGDLKKVNFVAHQKAGLNLWGQSLN
ncbi:MAG: hypothetical protein HY753_03700 [Nitrospirae bacterium]|nr:hypothetical protein [Nitrospirota bacterium]